jgi:UDP-GlcNAc:undecaprenyl-phosphate GlcNAc-1-phosphate transferase
LDDIQKPSILISGISEEAILRWLVLFVAVLLGGVAGFLSILVAHALMLLARHQPRARVSNLGGVVIFSFIVFSYTWLSAMTDQIALSQNVLNILLTSTWFFLVGVKEDFRKTLSYWKRKALIAASVAVYLLIQPEALLNINDKAMFLSFLVTFLVLLSLILGFDKIDGADGLLSGVALLVIVGLLKESSGEFQLFLTFTSIACAIFLLFNLAVGRIYVGDGGAYFLGASIGLIVIIMLQDRPELYSYFLCLLFYPHASFIFSLVRRYWIKKALARPDYRSVHNVLFYQLKHSRLFGAQANVVTGISLALIFTGIPLFIKVMNFSVNWLICYIILWLCFVFIWFLCVNIDTRKSKI